MLELVEGAGHMVHHIALKQVAHAVERMAGPFSPTVVAGLAHRDLLDAA